MIRISKLALAAIAFAALSLAPAALRAQAAPAAKAATTDTLAFPRKFVQWVMSAEGDSAWAHAAPALREGMKSPQDVKAMPSRIAQRFGAPEGTDAEVQFDDGALKVYIVVMRYSMAPGPGAWVVAYNPATGVVERAAFTSAETVKKNYPQAKLP